MAPHHLLSAQYLKTPSTFLRNSTRFANVGVPSRWLPYEQQMRVASATTTTCTMVATTTSPLGYSLAHSGQLDVMDRGVRYWGLVPIISSCRSTGRDTNALLQLVPPVISYDEVLYSEILPRTQILARTPCMYEHLVELPARFPSVAQTSLWPVCLTHIPLVLGATFGLISFRLNFRVASHGWLPPCEGTARSY